MTAGPLRSLRVRLTIWYMLLLAVTLATVGVGVYFALRESLYSNLDDSIQAREDLVRSVVIQDNDLDVTGVQLPGDPLEGEHFIRVYDAEGRLVFDNTAGQAVPEDPDAIQSALEGQSSGREVDANGVHLQVDIQALTTDRGTVGVMEVGLSDDDARDTLRSFLLILALAYPLALIAATGGGIFLASRALSPIDRLTRVARKITAEDLSQRLDLRLPDDEVGRLAQTFDEMIARLDESFRRQRQFTADASHELRTPLTALKGQAEVALQRDRDIEGYKEVLTAVNAEVDRMIRLVASLLNLARADSGEIPITREPVDLGRVITDAAEQLRPAAEAKNLTLRLQSGPDVTLAGDQDLLLQLVLNLVDNAIKYTPSGGAVDVTWSADGRAAEIRVSDTGPGIAAEHLPRIFDRFYRIDKARSRDGGGSGLGLSISRWIAETHGGSIDVTSEPDRGTTFVVHLPSA